MAITFPAGTAGAEYTNPTTGVKYYWDTTDGVWKTHVWPTNTNYLQLSGGTLTGDLSLGTNDLTAQDINSTTLTTTGGVTVGNGLTVSDGNVVMASGHGIDFSADANATGMTSELFDDYEEGTWSPVFTQGVTNPGYTVTTGSYTKIGDRVFISFRIQVSSGTNNSDHVKVGGLPFQSSGTQDEGGCTINYTNNLVGASNNNPTLHIAHGSYTIDWYDTTGGTWIGTEGNGLVTRTFHIHGQYPAN